MSAGEMASAEITRAECRERARLLRVRSYDVALDLTRGDQVFGSVSVVRFDCAEPGAASHADLVACAVHEITLNGARLDPAAAWSGGRIALPGGRATSCAWWPTAVRGRHGDAPVGGCDDGGTYIYGKRAQHMRTANTRASTSRT